jgi:hypothetical protein
VSHLSAPQNLTLPKSSDHNTNRQTLSGAGRFPGLSVGVGNCDITHDW